MSYNLQKLRRLMRQLFLKDLNENKEFGDIFSPNCFDMFTIAKRSHWKLFKNLDIELYGEIKDPDDVDLKVYQDLLIFAFIKKNISPGSRILEVGGGRSRILKHFIDIHECWNIDRLEGLGHGPKGTKDVPGHLVKDYMGNYNHNIPNDYFDLVFSISALEHIPKDDPTFYDNVLEDINRVLKPGGYSLHTIDIVLTRYGTWWVHPIIDRIRARENTLNTIIRPDEMSTDKDLYFMSEKAYNKTWFRISNKPYERFGFPSNISILWRK